MHYRTSLADAILADVSAGLDADAVRGVFWAARDDVELAVKRRDVEIRPHATLVDHDEWQGASL